MRIVDFRIHSIAIGDPPLRSSYGLHAPYALRTILELEGEDGYVGISETHGGDVIARQFAALRPLAVGADAFTLPATLGWMIGAGGDTQATAYANAGAATAPGATDAAGAAAAAGAARADRSQTWRVPGENPLDADTRLYSALEIASLDLVGKALGRPLCDLLGGRVRDRVPFSAYLFYKHAGGGGEGDDRRDDEYGEGLDPEAMVRQAKQMMATYGFTSVKLKAGVLEPAAEIETMRALRRALGPSVPLRLDPNCAWSVETSIAIGRALRDELDGEGYLEDPAAGLDGMAAVRAALLAEGIRTPLASNVAVTSFGDLRETVATDAVQIVLCDPHYWGGARQIQQLARLCQAFGLGLSMHSNSHLGVSLMAMAHAAAAAPHLTFACDTHYPWQHEADEVVLGGRVPIVEGCVTIPDRPGLGVELDPDRLARGRERYARCAYRKRDDEAEMRTHVDPSWTRTLPRW